MNKVLLISFVLFFAACTHLTDVQGLEKVFSSSVNETEDGIEVIVLPINKMEISEGAEAQVKRYWSHLAKTLCNGAFSGEPTLSFTMISHDGVKDGHRWGYTEMLLKSAIGIAKCH